VSRYARWAAAAWVALAIASWGCGETVRPEPEQYYVAPPRLELHEQLGLQSGVSGLALHGDRVEVVERRRRFVRIRLSSGAMGWGDSADLLNTQQWAKLERLATQSETLPTQAVAAPFDALNVHTDPNRQSPTFYVAKEEEALEIIGHLVTPRVAHDSQFAAGFDPAIVPTNAPLDDWHLVRLVEPGKAATPAPVGWALSRLLFVQLPDPVTQQANRAAIMAAVPLGRVETDGVVHQHWLMGTIAGRNLPFDFDTLRVLGWNADRERYDVTFLEKDLRGYYPVELKPASGGGLAGFSLWVETAERVREHREYKFAPNSRRPKATVLETITLPAPVAPHREDYVAKPPPPPVPSEPPYWQRVQTRWHKAWKL
jgi:hypothetical protein